MSGEWLGVCHGVLWPLCQSDWLHAVSAKTWWALHFRGPGSRFTTDPLLIHVYVTKCVGMEATAGKVFQILHYFIRNKKKCWNTTFMKFPALQVQYNWVRYLPSSLLLFSVCFHDISWARWCHYILWPLGWPHSLWCNWRLSVWSVSDDAWRAQVGNSFIVFGPVWNALIDCGVSVIKKKLYQMYSVHTRLFCKENSGICPLEIHVLVDTVRGKCYSGSISWHNGTITCTTG